MSGVGPPQRLLEVRDVRLSFGGVRALDDASFDIAAGTVTGLIGPNGAGKTTLFNVISGLYRPDGGVVRYRGTDLLALRPHRVIGAGVARTFQNLGVFPERSVLDNVMLGAVAGERLSFSAVAFGLPRARRATRRARQRALDALARVQLTDRAAATAGTLPYGLLKRVEIARALAAEPTLLMLDEPAAGLTHGDAVSLGELLRELVDGDRAILLVEHHMRLVMSVCDHVVALDAGRVIADGTPAEVGAHPAVVAAYLGGAA